MSDTPEKNPHPNIDAYQPQVSNVYVYPSAEQINAAWKKFDDDSGGSNPEPVVIQETGDIVGTYEHDGRPARGENIERKSAEPIMPKELPAHWQAHYSDLQKGGLDNQVEIAPASAKVFRYQGK